MRILLVDDEAVTSQSVALMLRAEGYLCDITDLGKDGVEIGKNDDYDAILLDLMLPDITGHEVLRRLRNAGVQTPILILSGLSDTLEKVRTLGSGADDYLTKPFDKRELIARLKAIVRRSQAQLDSVIQTGKLTLNLDQKVAEIDGHPLHLTGKEYGILELLSLRKGTTVAKEMFLSHLYGGIDEPEIKIVDVFVCKLRKKVMEHTDGDDYIKTIWGRGYTMIDPSTQTGSQTLSP